MGGWVSDYKATSGPQLNSWSWVEFSWVGQLGPGVAKIELRAESLGTFFTEKSLEAPIFSYTGQTLQHGHWTFLPIFTKIGYKTRPLDVFCSFSALFGGGGSNVWPLLQKNVLVTFLPSFMRIRWKMRPKKEPLKVEKYLLRG